MSSKVTCFVAYPSVPASLVETIETAIERIKQAQVVEIDSWKSTSVAGKFIMMAICEAIDKRDLFICDLTNLNHNVLFEVGYAIARKKRIWTLLDPSIERSTVDYERFRLLTTIGYSPYRNSREIENAFYQQRPHTDLESTIYKDAIESVIGREGQRILLYLKSGVETEASITLSRRIHKSHIPIVVDDPNEIRIQTLSWYAQMVHNAHAVVVHFLSPEHAGWRLHNAKNSFVSGLAYGFGRHLLMIAHEPYESPIDYRELLQIHRTAAQCESIVGSWIELLEQDFAQRTVTAREYLKDVRAQSELQSISIGDPVAEHEAGSLVDYFVPTAAYREALESKHAVFVGRKGAGKTAILYKLKADIESDVRNHVCIIKPIAYELEGILRMLKQALPKSEKGYLIESFWKFLIYTELAKSVYEALQGKPVYYQKDGTEEELLRYVEDNASIITPDFSIRLESIVATLQDVSDIRTAKQQRNKISELLHDNVIEKLRALLGHALERKNKIAILVDNLDKAWNQREDIATLSDLLFGLLGVSRRISRDFERSDHWRRPVNLCILIFVRSDILSEVLKYAREKDKVSYSRIVWEDRHLLCRVLEERFFASSDVLGRPEEMWPRFACSTVKGIPTKEYLMRYVLPRPRDLIYLARTALAQAINRRHARLEEEDILEAQKKYSQYALDSIVVGNSIHVEQLEALLYEFVGSSEVIDRDDILNAMRKCKIPKSKVNDVVELLFELTFLGREVEANRFEFLYNEEDKVKWQVMARKVAEGRGDRRERFRINEAFHAYLEIVPVLMVNEYGK